MSGMTKGGGRGVINTIVLETALRVYEILARTTYVCSLVYRVVPPRLAGSVYALFYNLDF